MRLFYILAEGKLRTFLCSFLGKGLTPDLFLQGTIVGPYQDDEECAKGMEAHFTRWPLNSVQEVGLSPLNLCEFEPDLVVVYGNLGQILVLVHAANFRRDRVSNPQSVVGGLLDLDDSGYPIQGMYIYDSGIGGKGFAGTQDHEISFAIPSSEFENVVEGLDYVGRKGAYRYPVPTLSVLSQPKIP